MQNNAKDPSKKLVYIVNLFLFFSSFITLFLLIFSIYKYFISENINKEFYLIYISIFFVLLTLLIYGIKKFDANLKINFALLIFVLGVSFYSLEIYLQFFNKNNTAKIAKKMGIDYDKRSTKDVLVDLRNKGYNAHPNIKPTFFKETNGINLINTKERVYPLGTISNSVTVLGNESGYYPIITTDEHGFNNPKGLYGNKKLDIVLIGDSFTEGKAVRDNENISAKLRDDKYEVINLGKSGNGPLIEFATLKEFGTELKPKILLWFYFAENDLGDLEKELKSTILKEYLENNDFSQNLINRQKEIDKTLIYYSNQKFKINNNNQVKNIKNKIIDVLKLYYLRLMFKARPSNEPTPVISEILKKSNNKVSDWGGKMYFVYLPARGHVHPTRDFIINSVKEQNIPIIDIKNEVFDNHPDPLSLFPLRLYAHYNAKGYELIAKVISKRLKADGFNP